MSALVQEATHRAWQVVGLGEPADAVRLVDTPTPVRAAGEVLVEVHAVGLGFPDLLLARGSYHDKPELPFTLGSEAAGVVLEADPDAGFAAGDRVIVVPGQVARGLMQERLVVPAERLLPVPAGMPITQAGALVSAYQTSYIGLVRRCHLQRGEWVLVLGASGGIGSAAVEIARARGARVVAAARGAAKVAHCRELGADVVLDLDGEDLAARMREVTGGHGADIVFDPIGGALTDSARRCVALEGRLLVIGFASGEIPVVPVNHALLRNYSVVGCRTWPFRGDAAYRAEVHADLTAMHRRGEISPRVEVLPFADAVAGLQRLAESRVAGRIVLTTEAAR